MARQVRQPIDALEKPLISILGRLNLAIAKQSEHVPQRKLSHCARLRNNCRLKKFSAEYATIVRFNGGRRSLIDRSVKSHLSQRSKEAHHDAVSYEPSDAKLHPGLMS